MVVSNEVAWHNSFTRLEEWRILLLSFGIMIEYRETSFFWHWLLLMYVLTLKFFPLVSLVLRDTYKYTNIKRIYSKYINYAIIDVYLNHTITAVYHSRLQKYRGSHVNKSHDADITAELDLAQSWYKQTGLPISQNNLEGDHDNSLLMENSVIQNMLSIKPTLLVHNLDFPTK